MNREFDFGEAQRQKDKGMERARGSSRSLSWSVDAGRWFIQLPLGTIFTPDDVARNCGLPDEGVNRNNAVGAWINALARAKLIQWTGRTVKSQRVNRHAGENKEWIKVKG